MLLISSLCTRMSLWVYVKDECIKWANGSKGSAQNWLINPTKKLWFYSTAVFKDTVVWGHTLNIKHSNEQLVILNLLAAGYKDHVLCRNQVTFNSYGMVFLAKAYILSSTTVSFQCIWKSLGLWVTSAKVGRWKGGYQRRYQMLYHQLYCTNPFTSGREIKRCCSFPAALHL